MGWVLAIALLVAGCGPGAQASHGGDGADAVPVSGVVLAGPICPVESVSPDPSCADRPVSGAELVIEATAGGEVLRVTSGPDGEFRMRLAPGAYRLVPQEVEGLMGTAGPMDLVVSAEPISDLVVSYDTGIR